MPTPVWGAGRVPPPVGEDSAADSWRGLGLAHPYMGGGPRPSPVGRGSPKDCLQRLKLAHPYMGGGPRPSPAGRGSNLAGQCGYNFTGIWVDATKCSVYKNEKRNTKSERKHISGAARITRAAATSRTPQPIYAWSLAIHDNSLQHDDSGRAMLCTGSTSAG